mgnify:CR=1 FL=1
MDEIEMTIKDLRGVNEKTADQEELAKALRMMNRKEKRAFIKKLRKNIKRL